MNAENLEKKDTTEAVEKFTSYTYVKNEVIYPIDDVTGQRSGKPAEMKQSEQEPESAAKHLTLKEAVQAFLEAEKWQNGKDGEVFYAEQGEHTYVGFARVDEQKMVHEHLAVFFRVEAEVTTKMTAFDVSLQEVKDAFSK